MRVKCANRKEEVKPHTLARTHKGLDGPFGVHAQTHPNNDDKINRFCPSASGYFDYQREVRAALLQAEKARALVAMRERRLIF